MASGSALGPCLACREGNQAHRYRLKYPQPDITPPSLRWEPPGPPLFMCDECGREAAAWAEPVGGE